MSVSIYYEATRDHPLTETEQATVKKLVARFAVEELIIEKERTGKGHNWESFCIYPPDEHTEPNVIFEGATKLPTNSDESARIGLRHWCRLLSEIRRVLSEASWWVRVDDCDIPWDEEYEEYRPIL